jgi:UDP:flavonoid glycosyltransferase YjiC (YdhE family)
LTEIPKINKISLKKPKILIAPLDWGLGHATRCIPVIKELIKNECEVIVASEGPQMALLKQEFPLLRFVPLRGYRLRFGRNRWLTNLRIIFQIPKLLIRINRENRWLGRFIAREHPDAVISDNRYGLCSPSILSVFITHQLYIRTPLGRAVEKKLQQINYRYINRFSICWIPDYEKNHTLTGQLAHPEKLPSIALRYLGPLTRFERISPLPLSLPALTDILVLLSGPEPQRTILEKILIKEIRQHQGNAVMVRGLPGRSDSFSGLPNLLVYNHLPAETLNRLICDSKFVISRSGYSSVMDILSLGKKSILIPTPGQSEQEYLASYLFDQHLVFRAKQGGFSLKNSLDAARKFPFVDSGEPQRESFSRAITELMQEIDRRKTG